MYERVIFLDIDGVLNTTQYRNAVSDFDVMDPANVVILQRVVETTQAVIVISSSWRFGACWEERIRRVLSQSGWCNPPIIGRTLESPGGRGQEITAWLDEHLAADFVVVDDDAYEMRPEHQEHLIHCNRDLGFTIHNAQEIERRWT